MNLCSEVLGKYLETDSERGLHLIKISETDYLFYLLFFSINL